VWSTVAWVLQVLLAVVFLFHGIWYAFSPGFLVRSMRERGQWPPPFPAWFRTFIGVAEILAAVGLVLPGLFHLLTFLTPLAAAGLVIVLIGAAVFHWRRREFGQVPPLLITMVLATVVLFVRWQVSPLT
jgi:uncharacterized membrane protein YphA (DoxX/SURF4 family)